MSGVKPVIALASDAGKASGFPIPPNREFEMTAPDEPGHEKMLPGLTTLPARYGAQLMVGTNPLAMHRLTASPCAFCSWRQMDSCNPRVVPWLLAAAPPACRVVRQRTRSTPSSISCRNPGGPAPAWHVSTLAMHSAPKAPPYLTSMVIAF